MKPIAFLLLIPCAWAQVLKLEHLDKLAAKATETVNITLDASLLNLASRFIPQDDSEAGEIKKLIAGLKGIWIRSFEFKNAGEYADADIDAIRKQLRDSDWKRIVEVRSKSDGDADVYLKMAAGSVAGLAVISAEPKELTIVSIDGPIDVDGLAKLSGNFGIPRSIRNKAKKSEEKK